VLHRDGSQGARGALDVAALHLRIERLPPLQERIPAEGDDDPQWAPSEARGD
jgi:hypothetical protein